MPSVNARLATLLEQINRPGSFSMAGTAEFLAPALQAETLIAAAELAPYGKGEQTRVNPIVRRCWQIAPERVQLTGRRWSEALDKIVARPAQDQQDLVMLGA